MTYKQALEQLPFGAQWSCSFGNPGEDGYVEYWRKEAARWNICRKDYRNENGWVINRIGDARKVAP